MTNQKLALDGNFAGSRARSAVSSLPGAAALAKHRLIGEQEFSFSVNPSPLPGMESFREEILQILSRLGASFSSKIPHFIAFFFDPMHANSIGALAGFAIALICTWKYLKAPGKQQKRLEKREERPESSKEYTAAASSTSVSLHHTHSTQRGAVIRDPQIPIQLTLTQLVRKQLNGARKMTCQLLGVVFEETSPEELQKHAVVRPAVVDVLLELAQACDLYLMARLLDDESEVNALTALESVGLFSFGGLNRNKVLFCSTEAGKTSFVRQLEPDWHIDTSMETISQLSRFVRYELHVSPKGTGSLAPHVLGSESLESYFGRLGPN